MNEGPEKNKWIFMIFLAAERDLEKIGLLHLCTCLFVVAAAGIQNLTGESQRADGLQMNLPSVYFNELHITH